MSKEPNNGIEILVGQAAFKLWIKIVKIMFGPITQELLDLTNFFDANFEFLGQLTIICIFQKGVDNFDIEHKTWLGVQYPLKHALSGTWCQKGLVKKLVSNGSHF